MSDPFVFTRNRDSWPAWLHDAWDQIPRGKRGSFEALGPGRYRLVGFRKEIRPGDILQRPEGLA